MSARRCQACGEPLVKRRADARFCTDKCRRMANRAARLAAGKPDGHYQSLVQWEERRRRGFARL